LVKIALDVLNQILITLWHVVPWLAGIGLVFAVLSRLSPCNQGRPWWEKRGLATDLAYWIFVPIFTRYLRIWVTVTFTIWLFHISDGQKIAAFYANGHGPVSALPLWFQAVLYLVGTDFMLYWSHRAFHQGALWKYHAVHHATQDLDWISAARFHPLNLMFGVAAADIVALLCGISPQIFVVMGPVNIITSCLVHANLNWTFGPLRHVIASPVFHRWHHDKKTHGRNFSGSLSLWDWMFGTYHMPEGALPQSYGIDDRNMPEGLFAQIVYPLTQSAEPVSIAQGGLAEPTA
jgi:sterol desaturase/sphingolipid hydroxylase (fatty acid hydroxylase superfamily)